MPMQINWFDESKITDLAKYIRTEGGDGRFFLKLLNNRKLKYAFYIS